MRSMAGATRLPLADPRPLDRQLVVAVALTLFILFGFVSLWLAARRLSGAFTRPLSGLEIVAAAVVIESVALGIRCILANTQVSKLRAQYSLAITIAVIITVASLILPGTPILGTLLALIVLLGAETASWFPSASRYLDRFFHLRPLLLVQSRGESATEDTETPPGLFQRLTRVREAAGESIHVLASAEIPAHDRLGVVHVSFVPALASRPELTAHAMDTDDIEVRLTQVETFGARMEVRVPQAEPQPRHILIEVLGSATVPRSA